MIYLRVPEAGKFDAWMLCLDRFVIVRKVRLSSVEIRAFNAQIVNEAIAIEIAGEVSPNAQVAIQMLSLQIATIVEIDYYRKSQV